MKKVLVLAAFLVSGMFASAQISTEQNPEKHSPGKPVNTANDNAADLDMLQEKEQMESNGQNNGGQEKVISRRVAAPAKAAESENKLQQANPSAPIEKTERYKAPSPVRTNPKEASKIQR